jgi:hypothetical protein
MKLAKRESLIVRYALGDWKGEVDFSDAQSGVEADRNRGESRMVAGGTTPPNNKKLIYSLHVMIGHSQYKVFRRFCLHKSKTETSALERSYKPNRIPRLVQTQCLSLTMQVANPCQPLVCHFVIANSVRQKVRYT